MYQNPQNAPRIITLMGMASITRMINGLVRRNPDRKIPKKNSNKE